MNDLSTFQCQYLRLNSQQYWWLCMLLNSKYSTVHSNVPIRAWWTVHKHLLGGLIQMKNHRENFGPLLRFEILRTPFLPWKLWVNPIEKHVGPKLNFHRKICGDFCQGPLTRVTNLKDPLFTSGPPNKCLCTVPELNVILWYFIWTYRVYLYQCTRRFRETNTIMNLA